jgi:phosphoribosylglycinamide formyltransferase-1
MARGDTAKREQAPVIGVLVSGEGTNLQALLDEGLPVTAVASNRPGVRALERAAAASVPGAVFPLGDYASRAERDAAMADWLAERGVRLVVCAGYMHLLTPGFLERFPVLNVHPSLLPAFPGMHAIEDALAAGIPETGVTVHFVDEGVDTGPVVLQEAIAVRPDDTADTLRPRLRKLEHRLLPQAARMYLEGRLRSPDS